MKITKYPQSHLIVEKSGISIQIDPGYLTFETYPAESFPQAAAILITHQHKDHMEPKVLKGLVTETSQIFGNKAVAKALAEEDILITPVEDGKEFSIGPMKIKPIEIPHCELLFCPKENRSLTAEEISREKVCKAHPEERLKTSAGPPNTGFLIDGVFFHPGDGIKLVNSLKSETAAIPINGPTIDFQNAWALAASLKAKRVLPIHYTHPTFLADPVEFSIEKPGEEAKVVILADKESIEI